MSRVQQVRERILQTVAGCRLPRTNAEAPEYLRAYATLIETGVAAAFRDLAEQLAENSNVKPGITEAIAEAAASCSAAADQLRGAGAPAEPPAWVRKHIGRPWVPGPPPLPGSPPVVARDWKPPGARGLPESTGDPGHRPAPAGHLGWPARDTRLRYDASGQARETLWQRFRNRNR
jgi:hypothetical protein